MGCTAIKILQKFAHIFGRERSACWLKRLGTTCCLSFLFPCLSSANPLGDTFTWRDGGYQRNIQMNILPTRMMDDETLFLAAETAREQHMCAAQRLLNNRWLIENDQNTYSGEKAVSKILKMTVLQLWHLKTGNTLAPQTLSDDNDAPLSLTAFDNYNLNLSGGGLQLSLKLRFD